MKKIIINIALSLVLLFLIANCNNPVLTELDNNNNNNDVQVQNNDFSNFILSGYDSTGNINSLPRAESIIQLTGIKNSFGNINNYQSIFQAAFFDKSKPYKNGKGNIIGFKATPAKSVHFGDVLAPLKPLRIQYVENDFIVDTTIGIYHQINKRSFQRIFPFNSFINVKVGRGNHNNNREFRIKTINEINGIVRVIGSRKNKDLKIDFEWNGQSVGKVNIIVGGKIKSLDKLVPLFAIDTRDDGNFILPRNYINSIPFDLFSNLTISFIRENKLGSNGSVNVVSKSIHNIGIIIPE